ncbi:MAG: DMT family transporter [Euryarchaeota archaeon]|nr:DMT family transporter [Euryarchaeota archaeon]
MRQLWGYLSVIVATIFFGISSPFNKILLENIHPLPLAALTYIIAGVFLFIIRFSPLKERILKLLDKKSESETHISQKDYGILITTALFGTVIAPFVFLSGLNNTTAVNASLLMNSETLFIIIIGFFILQERFVKKDVLGFIFLIIGTLFLTTNGQIEHFSVSSDIGNLLIIAAAFFWSVDTSLSKFLSNKRDLILISALKCLIGGLVLLLLSLMLDLSFKIPFYHLPYLFVIGILSIGASFVLVYFAIREIGSTRVGSLFSLASLFGAIFAFLILSEPFTITQMLFGLLMLFGVFILYKNNK